jgi:hypothetical protein
MALLVVIGALRGDTVTAWPLSAYKTSWMMARLLVVGAGMAAVTKRPVPAGSGLSAEMWSEFEGCECVAPQAAWRPRTILTMSIR